ncbi:deleted in lung and esophageal cancer protein 1 isoform X4 [Canis lupus familiaris]|uniref:deleted in lung and esophageal cancer protein 1 isoform X4 n=1 Tax=Canis lupus familiaris TaxID=9615 RepID=UPI0018F2C8D0|nr:deleted in lung and esophageal cancer protein 1 isoform X4 [Canis lupus familiaris]XP_038426360.1 deleted in lung and esophageal cancer protein 1 isoform X4 [Canis lupus familiaris]
METGGAEAPQSGESGSCALGAATWTPASRVARGRSPSEATRLPSLAYSEAFHYGFGSRARRVGPPTPQPLPEPHLLRLRPTSLRTQDVSHLLTGVFRNLYTDEVVGADLSASLIKARGGEDARHEEFVDELRRIREVYKQRLDEVEMLERHIIQARARALAEKERIMQQAKVHVLENFITVPPVKSIFRWCVDSELLQKHHLISPDDYYSDTVPFCSAPKGVSIPGYSKLTFSCEKHSVPKKHLTKKLEASCEEMLTKVKDELDYTVDSQTGDLSLKGKCKTVKAGPSKNAKWMSHLHVPQRELERLLLVRMESRNRFLKNPRFFPPNTPQGGKSLLFPPKKPMLTGDFPSGDLEESCVDTPVFLAKPSIGFFTDYEIGPVYEMVISLQNTTATSRYLRVIPPSTPYFALGLGMFPGKGGMVAPGMTCQYTVQFFPDCLGDFDDFILVETQSAHTLLIPLQARRPPPVLTLSPVLDCGYCLIGGMKITRFICKNVGFSVGKFCIMPKKSWPPPSFRAVATIGFVEQPPFGILPSVFELAPGQAVCMEVLFLPTSLEKAEQTFIVVCDNCQIKELVTVGIGQLVALDLIYISGEESHPEPGELTDLTAQHFIRFEPENLQSTARKQLIIRNATHVELAFHWQIMKPNLQSLMPGETYSLDSLKYHPDRETAFSILPERGVLGPHTDHEFILTFSPHELRDFHSVLQMVLEEVPEPLSLELENLKDSSFSVDDVIVLEIEVKGSVEPFQLLLEPYALIIPGENYVGINVKKDFKMWNNSKSPIRYLWGKISDCHIIEVEPCAGTIEPNEVEDFELSFTGGVPGPVSQDLLCEIQNSPSPVVLHIEAAFKGPALVISVSALQFGLLRLGQKATNSIQIQNISQLPATWCMKESPVCLQERHEDVSPFDIEPSSGQIHPLGECRVNITLEAKQCQRLQTVLELEVVNGTWSYLPVYAEVQEPYVYLQSSHVEVRNLYLGVPAKATITLINGTLLPTRFHWSKLLGHQASVCTAKVSPRRGTLGPSEERQLNLELTAHTEEELSDLALPCTVSGMKEPLVLGISGKPQGLQVAIAISMEGSDSSVPSTALWPGHLEELRLDFGSKVPLRTRMNCQLILTNHSPIQTPFTLKFEYFGSPQNSLNQKPSLFYGKHVVTWERSCLLSPHFPGHTGGPPTAEHRHHRLCQHVGRVLGQPHLHDIRLDWETYTPEDREDRLLELLVFYGPPFPLRDQAGNDLSCPETPESSSSFWSSSPSNTSDSSHEAAQSAEGSDRASQKIISVVLREHDGVPADHLYCVSPKQVVVPTGGSSTISISYTPMVLGPEVLHKVKCVGYALGFMSLDDEAERELPGRRHRLQDFAAGPLRLDLCGYVRPAQLSMELDYGGGVEFRHQASDLIPEQPCTGVLSELVTTHHLKLTNTTEIPQYFQLLVSRPFSVSQEGASRSRRAPGPGREEEPATASKQLVLHPQENMLVNVSFSLSLELLSYQKLPADQMLPGVDIRQHASGEKEMVFTQSLLLEYANHTTQVVPLRATVAVPELQLSTSWVDFGTCFVNQERVREVYLMNLSGCRSYWAVLMGRLGLPPTSCAGWHLVGGPAEKAGSQIPSDPRVALLHGPGPDPRCTPGMRWGKCGGNTWSCPGSCVPPSLGVGQQDPDKDLAAFRVSPNSGLLEARLVNAPPNTITLQVFFTARSSELYESTLVVEGMLGEKACTLRLRGRGSYDERYMSPHQL